MRKEIEKFLNPKLGEKRWTPSPDEQAKFNRWSMVLGLGNLADAVTTFVAFSATQNFLDEMMPVGAEILHKAGSPEFLIMKTAGTLVMLGASMYLKNRDDLRYQHRPSLVVLKWTGIVFTLAPAYNLAATIVNLPG